MDSGEPNLGKAAKERLEFNRINQRYSTIRTLVRAAGVVLVVFFMSQTLKSLSGQATSVIVSATLSLFADVKFALAITLAGAASVWAVAERMLRRRKVEYMQGRIRELEMRIDPNRTTSGLTTRGMTNPRDGGR
jgi:hypothetical protein